MKRIESIEQAIVAKNKYEKQIETHNAIIFKEIDTKINRMFKTTEDTIDKFNNHLDQRIKDDEQRANKMDKILEYMTKKNFVSLKYSFNKRLLRGPTAASFVMNNNNNRHIYWLLKKKYNVLL